MALQGQGSRVHLPTPWYYLRAVPPQGSQRRACQSTSFSLPNSLSAKPLQLIMRAPAASLKAISVSNGVWRKLQKNWSIWQVSVGGLPWLKHSFLVVAVGCSALAVRAAAKANKLSHDFFIAEQRPWVTVEPRIASDLVWTDSFEKHKHKIRRYECWKDSGAPRILIRRDFPYGGTQREL